MKKEKKKNLLESTGLKVPAKEYPNCLQTTVAAVVVHELLAHTEDHLPFKHTCTAPLRLLLLSPSRKLDSRQLWPRLGAAPQYRSTLLTFIIKHIEIANLASSRLPLQIGGGWPSYSSNYKNSSCPSLSIFNRLAVILF